MKKNQVNNKKNSSRNNQMMEDDLFKSLPIRRAPKIKRIDIEDLHKEKVNVTNIQELPSDIEEYLNSQIAPIIKFEVKHHVKISLDMIKETAFKIAKMFNYDDASLIHIMIFSFYINSTNK